MMNMRKARQIGQLAERIESDANRVKYLLLEIRMLAVKKGNCKDIWKLAGLQADFKQKVMGVDIDLRSIEGQPEDPPEGSEASVRTLLALAWLFGAEIVPSRETEIPYGYICTACGLNIHVEGCRAPRGLKRVVSGFRISRSG